MVDAVKRFTELHRNKAAYFYISASVHLTFIHLADVLEQCLAINSSGK